MALQDNPKMAPQDDPDMALPMAPNDPLNSSGPTPWMTPPGGSVYENLYLMFLHGLISELQAPDIACRHLLQLSTFAAQVGATVDNLPASRVIQGILHVDDAFSLIVQVYF